MLKPGTYVREPDGAWHLFHTELEWPTPVLSLRHWQNHEGFMSRSDFRKIEEQDERDALREYLCGELLPGEYVTVEGS